MAVWQCLRGAGGYESLSVAASAALEKLYVDMKGRGEASLDAEGLRGRLACGEVLSLTREAGEEMKLRRMYSGWRWEWESHTPHGAPVRNTYEPLLHRQIDQAYRAGRPSVTVAMLCGQRRRKETFEIDFACMLQRNTASGRTRKMSNVAVLTPLTADRRLDSSGALVYFKRDRSPTPPRDLLPSLSPKQSPKRARVDPPPSAAPGPGTGPPNGDVVVDNWTTDAAAGLMVLPAGVHGAAKIAAFDLDDTIITTKTGAVFAKTPSDWQVLHASIPGVLQRLRTKGYKIVLFTNQAGIGAGSGFLHTKAAAFREKVLAVARELGFSMQVFVMTGHGRLRKPCIGAWELMENVYNDGVAVDRARSFYCGDAAGRGIHTLANRQKDFSCGDRKFAANLGVPFFTPEELFLRQPPADFHWGTMFNPNARPLPATPTVDGRDVFHSTSQELVINVGPPASGKSTFTRKHFVPHGYVHISRDDLGTAAKCGKALRAALAGGHSAVLDNTSPAVATRAVYINIAQAAGVPVRCMHFDMDIAHAQHLNALRDVLSSDASSNKHVPHVAYLKFQSSLQPPMPHEGFAEVVQIRFCADFVDERHRRCYSYYLLP
eukprot:TRINITY_DN19526_c0_g1_i1.p1 TRINITY_DN19526_c0_g1~~TRINITY_DN19526_c0_g1_i1.p1  ORF type:complete len:604 (+),score=116.41 TRINITY_DN19526_c0_g1_i1:46-1857(+)